MVEAVPWPRRGSSLAVEIAAVGVIPKLCFRSNPTDSQALFARRTWMAEKAALQNL
jgi:hypothetical protein